MNIGILGCSQVFENAIIKPGIVNVMGIASRKKEKAEEYAKKYNIAKVYDSYEDLLNSDEIDTVYIAFPPILQPQWVENAIKNEKNVLVEKPLTIKYDEILQIEPIIMNSSRIVLEGVMTQFHPWQSYIKEIILGKVYGNIVRISTVINMIMPDNKMGFRNNKSLGGGVFYDQSSYWLQFLQYVVGLNFNVYNLKTLKKNEVDREIEFSGKIGGADVFFSASYEKEYEVNHEIIFEKATIKIKNFFRAAMGKYKITVEIISDGKKEKKIFEPQNYYQNQLVEFLKMDKETSNKYWEKTKERIYWIDQIGQQI